MHTNQNRQLKQSPIHPLTHPSWLAGYRSPNTHNWALRSRAKLKPVQKRPKIERHRRHHLRRRCISAYNKGRLDHMSAHTSELRAAAHAGIDCRKSFRARLPIAIVLSRTSCCCMRARACACCNWVFLRQTPQGYLSVTHRARLHVPRNFNWGLIGLLTPVEGLREEGNFP